MIVRRLEDPAAFLEAAQPSFAIISVGARNPFRHPTAEALSRLEIDALELKAKEALALINGTHFMAGIGALLVDQVANLLAFQPGEKVANVLTIKDFNKEEEFLMFATAKGTVKKTALKDVSFRSVPLTLEARTSEGFSEEALAKRLKDDPRPFKQIAIEIYRPVSGGLSLGGKFSPKEMKVPPRKDKEKPGEE